MLPRQHIGNGPCIKPSQHVEGARAALYLVDKFLCRIRAKALTRTSLIYASSTPCMTCRLLAENLSEKLCKFLGDLYLGHHRDYRAKIQRIKMLEYLRRCIFGRSVKERLGLFDPRKFLIPYSCSHSLTTPAACLRINRSQCQVPSPSRLPQELKAPTVRRDQAYQAC